MPYRVAINGFGRIGRNVFRAAWNNPDIDIVAINDPNALKYLVYALRFDSVRGPFPEAIETFEHGFTVGDKSVHVSHVTDPSHCPWEAHGIDVAIEASGRFLDAETVAGHLAAGAKKTIVTASTKHDIPMFVMGVNDDQYSDQNVLSNASCTTNCVAVITQALDDAFGIEEGCVATIHATTSSQKVIDANSDKGLRDGRSNLNNIIPTSTGATEALGRIIPSLQNKLSGISYRVPVNTVCAADINCRLRSAASKQDIDELFRSLSESSLKRYLGYLDDEVVSSDLIGNAMSAIYDAKASVPLNDRFIKAVAWYDNEWGYSNRLLDLVLHVCK
jgi:glyceraldehyde 3-phosphate dehydrogenase